MVIENKTKLDFACKIEAICYQSDEEDHITLLLDNNNGNNLNITFDQGLDENNNEFLRIIINFTCGAETTFVYNPMFSENNILFNPEIKNVDFTHQSLQIINFCTPQNSDQRYFSIEQHKDFGIIAQMHPISMHIKCLNNFKQMVQALLAAAMHVTNLLPY